METIVIVVHMLAAIAIIGLILLQQGKGAEMGASFGAGGSQTLFGSRGSGNLFSRATAILAAVFFATSFGLAFIAKERATVEDRLEISTPVQEVPAAEENSSDVPAANDAPESDVPMCDVPVVDESASDVPTAEETPETN
jgi:preprotein translocase subunit SecG